MSEQFTHLDAAGHARMVDVTAKQPTVRAATASGRRRGAAPPSSRPCARARPEG